MVFTYYFKDSLTLNGIREMIQLHVFDELDITTIQQQFIIDNRELLDCSPDHSD